jgi:hypothetical protein
MTRATRRGVDGLDYWSIGDARMRPVDAVHLLPIYDEYLIAYRDRVAVPHGASTVRATFRHALLVGGHVAGTWTVRNGSAGPALRVTPTRRLSPGEQQDVGRAAAGYARFIGGDLTLTIT